MITIYLRPLGELSLYINTLFVIGTTFYISGHDDDHRDIMLTMSRFVYPNDISAEYGFARIVEYAVDKVSHKCDVFCAIH